MNGYLLLQGIGLLLLLAAAARSDYKSHLVKNSLVAAGIIYGLTLNLLLGSWQGLADSLAGLAAPVALLMGFYLLRLLGAGDIKLLGSVGAIMGLEFVLKGILASFLIGGLLAFGLMLKRRNLKSRFRYLYFFLKSCFLHRSWLPYQEKGMDKGSGMPFAVAIGIGSLLLWGVQYPFKL